MNKCRSVDIYIDQLKSMVLDELSQEPVKVFVFGSRAWGTAREGSDVDIGLVAKGDLSRFNISLLKERIENSCIPYKVDLVDFRDVSKEFYEHALKRVIVWKS